MDSERGDTINVDLWTYHYPLILSLRGDSGLVLEILYDHDVSGYSKDTNIRYSGRYRSCYLVDVRSEINEDLNLTTDSGTTTYLR